MAQATMRAARCIALGSAAGGGSFCTLRFLVRETPRQHASFITHAARNRRAGVGTVAE